MNGVGFIAVSIYRTVLWVYEMLKQPFLAGSCSAHISPIILFSMGVLIGVGVPIRENVVFDTLTASIPILMHARVLGGAMILGCIPYSF